MIYDISQPISEAMTVYPGDPAVSIEAVSEVSEGATFGLSKISMGSHTGTHVDAPSHVLNGGKSVDGIPVEIMLGPCYLATSYLDMEISLQSLEKMEVPANTTRLLVRTRHAKGYLTPEAAAHLVETGVKLIGVDSASVDAPPSRDLPVHRKLLAADVVIVENLVLDHVEPGHYWLACLPLRIEGCDGAPARAVLMDTSPDIAGEAHLG